MKYSNRHSREEDQMVGGKSRETSEADRRTIASLAWKMMTSFVFPFSKD